MEPENILQYIKQCDFFLQDTVMPDTDHRYEFPYRAEMPSYILRPGNPYLDSLLFKWASANCSSTRSGLQPMSSGTNGSQSLYQKPYHTVMLVDPLLYSLKPSKWTTVSSNDVLMRALLKSYFLSGYPWLTFFHKDCFLRTWLPSGHGFVLHVL